MLLRWALSVLVAAAIVALLGVVLVGCERALPSAGVDAEALGPVCCFSDARPPLRFCGAWICWSSIAVDCDPHADAALPCADPSASARPDAGP